VPASLGSSGPDVAHRHDLDCAMCGAVSIEVLKYCIQSMPSPRSKESYCPVNMHREIHIYIYMVLIKDMKLMKRRLAWCDLETW
jgi:hypothetical protein